jgi:hypothetical protein
MEALNQIDAWEVQFAAAGVTRASGDVATRGDTARAVRLASVSKPVTALAVLVAAEEGVLDLDEAAGPADSTVRHLLAHTSGLPFDGGTPIATALLHVNEPMPPLPDSVPETLAMVVADLLAKNPADRPPNARAVAIRLGLADHEIAGLALGLARMVYGEDDEPDEEVRPLSRALLDPAPTMAADVAADLAES